ncbi:MAG: lycopene cyclase domain-containing protein, partial [Actinomycetota bacterium]|nr:lycopene cyclase domain-containing protein [Actinomycetota bacterium]
MMYTVWAVVAAALVVMIELVWLRTGLFRQLSYWVTLAISSAFQIPVDGWLTKRSAPIVIYNRHQFSGQRFPWDIPVEDFVYGFALVTLVLLLWVANERRSSTM